MGFAQRRRVLVVASACAAALATVPASGASSSAPAAWRAYRILHVCDGPPSMASDERAAILRALAKRGLVQGQNLEFATFDFDTAGEGGRTAFSAANGIANPYAIFLERQIPRMQAQLVLASGVRVVQGAQEAGRDTPVVFWRVTDPVGFGFVKTLAQPGGNITGFSRALEKLTVKRLELLTEMLPRARRVGFLFIEDYGHHKQQADDVRAAGESRGLTVVSYAVPMSHWSAAGLEDVFVRMDTDRIDAFLLPDINVQNQLVVELAAKHRLPTIHSLSQAVTDWGGLAAYTTSTPAELAAVSEYADRVLKGERPRDLPVQEPSQFELVLNPRAARAIGVSFPKTFMLRATRVVDK